MAAADLFAIFQTVTQALAENKQTINQADNLNHDHGDNMVEIFNVIAGAVKKKPKAPPADQLKYASKQLKKNVSSGTAQVYADGLKNASKKFAGKEISQDTAIEFIQTLLGGQTEDVGLPDANNPLLDSLLSGVMGTKTNTGQPDEVDTPVASLLSGLMGQNSSTGDSKIDFSDVVQIGLGYLQAKQTGRSSMEALASAVTQRTRMGQKQHRAASGQIVTRTLLDAITNFNLK